MSTELQRMHTSIGLILAYAPKASVEIHGEEIGIFDCKIEGMTTEQRKAILDLNIFNIISSGSKAKKFWNSSDQREDGDYFNYNEELVCIAEGEE